MTEQTTKRRGWVKNAIIIFLAVMLVLVFFSNTIMNRSLPEVATQYTSSGSINSMIRGTGTATANENYEVKIDQTRTVLATYVRVGDEVKPDTLLFKLQDAESDELGDLRRQLEDAEYSYQLALLDSSVSGSDQNNRDIQRAKDDLEAAQAELTTLEGKYPEGVSAIRSGIATLKAQEEAKKAALDKAQEELNALGGLNPGTDDYSGWNAVQRAEEEKGNAATNYQSVYLRFGADYEVLKSIGLDLAQTQVGTSYAQNAFMSALASEFGASGAVTTVPNTDGVFARHADGVHIQYPINSAEPDSNLHLKKDLANAYAQVTAAQEAKDEAQRAYDSALESYANSVDSGNSYEFNKLKKARDELQAEYNTICDELDKKTTFLSDYTSAKDNVYNLSNTLEDLFLQQKQLSVSQSKTALELQRQHDDIEKMRERIRTMEAGGSVTEVYANVSGIVRSVNVSSGSKAPADSVMASIDVVDRGYSLSMSVTAEQAEKLRVGDSAEVSGGYWGQKISATLVSIRNDPSTAGRGKLLMFNLTGDVESGSTLNVAIGERSQYYDVIVPNSAIHEDTSGNYVFVVEAKNSPLGNRYYATRENVTILAKDDNNAAVSGNLSGWGTSVITSAPPLTAGTQVRLAENG